MLATAVRMSKGGPGFFRKTADELSRATRIAWKLEGLDIAKDQYHLLDFTKEETVQGCKTMADRAVGGYSTASLDYVPADPETKMPAHARFHGSISTKLPKDWRIQRTGYAAFRNQDRGFWLMGRLYWDVDPYTYLALRVKSDGRRYTVNVQTDSIIESDIHQHRLFTRHHRLLNRPENHLTSSTITPEESLSEPESESDFPSTSTSSPSRIPAALADFAPPAEESNITSSSLSYITDPQPGSSGWETILIRWSDFVRTNLGTVVEPQTGLLQQRVKSIGIGLTDRVEGPYDLRIHRMWATNGLSGEELEEERRICGEEAVYTSAPASPVSVAAGSSSSSSDGSASTAKVESESGHVDDDDHSSLVERESRGLDRFKDLKGFQKK
ncbi:complex I intermediate-associated protein 30 [Nannizzia gypsea CBS 118893]|uniref:Complex I intermediate-associated protein 30 n=1 Tax=Arthroderma gypseum (strain ATCC MYA-4604 / CBS 118893) TaxID=535722 RepID=E4UWD7_ARTGP|nr:complex I intermediate-associated protein 30 [Nannizzia gypsea CBS 118893]EFR02532.1 complex I intermediate-associated protein 30 [Nannizzia gypsea CBS 118893]